MKKADLIKLLEEVPDDAELGLLDRDGSPCPLDGKINSRQVFHATKNVKGDPINIFIDEDEHWFKNEEKLEPITVYIIE